MDCSYAHFSKPQFTYLQSGERDTSFSALLWALGNTHIWGLHKGPGDKRPAPLYLAYRETEASKDPQKTNLSLAWSPVPWVGLTLHLRLYLLMVFPRLCLPGQCLSILMGSFLVRGRGALCPPPRVGIPTLCTSPPERLPRCSITHTIPGTQCSWPSTRSFT